MLGRPVIPVAVVITAREAGAPQKSAASPALAPWVEYLRRLPAHDRTICLHELMSYGVYLRLVLDGHSADQERSRSSP